MKSPFESKIPAHIQRSLSSPSDGAPQPALLRPGNRCGHRASSAGADSLAALTHENAEKGLPLEKARKMSSIPAYRCRDGSLKLDSARRLDHHFNTSLFQSPLDGRCVRH